VIKTSSFISIFLLLIAGVALLTTPLHAQGTLEVITLPFSDKPKFQLDESPRMYLPSKLVIGQDNLFVIKGKPGAKVSIAMSLSNDGSKPLLGKYLRLGSTELTIEGNISATGIVELKYKPENDKTLVEQSRYFEAVIWSKDDFSDLEVADVYSPSGKVTNNNSVVIALPNSNPNIPSFAPVLPGVGQEVIRSLQVMKDAKERKIDPDLAGDSYYLDSPEKRELMLQNIDTK
jgi:hypothetical protein